MREARQGTYDLSDEAETIANSIRALRDGLTAEGVTHIALFGSRARGDHRPDSDVDVMIEVEGDRPFSLLDLIGVQHIIGDEIGLAVNATMRRSLAPSFAKEIARDIRDVF